MKRERRWCFIIGSKGIPAHYGGLETFVEKLTQYSTNEQISYYVARMGTRDFWYGYNGAKCFSLAVPDIGPAKAVYYDLKALQKCIDYCKTHPYIKKPIFYVLACRIGPFIHFFKKQIRRLDGMLYVNPDGHEWMRQKWCLLIRKYWKFSERLMVRSADILICDSKNIEAYIRAAYVKYMPCTFYISYGADLSPSVLADDDPKFLGWCQEKGLKAKGYYLVVGRFVPENSFETIIREFMVSGSKYDLAIITTSNDRFLKKLERKLHFNQDERIKFVGSVYDQELLKKIRENAYGYLHGHTVGGTNPSLLEALSSTDLNLLLDVRFNREVGKDSALYWDKTPGNLAALIDRVEKMGGEEKKRLGRSAKERVANDYTWEKICAKYEEIFLKDGGWS